MTALITPFTKEGEIYQAALRNIVNFQVEKGVGSLWINGTYGSGPMMTFKQREKATEIVVEEVNERIPVVSHVGAPDTQTAVGLAKHAEDVGVHGIGSVTPYYYAFDEPEVLNYFEELVNAVSIPVFVYVNPFRTGFSVKPEFLLRLSEVGVAGVKDSSFNLAQFEGYLALRSIRKGFLFIMGTEALFFPALMLGSPACISGAANPFPEPNVELFNAFKREDYRRAKELQLLVSEIRRTLHIGPGISSCYEALRMRNIFDPGYPRSPMRSLTDEEKQKMREGLCKLGLLSSRIKRRFF